MTGEDVLIVGVLILGCVYVVAMVFVRIVDELGLRALDAPSFGRMNDAKAPLPPAAPRASVGRIVHFALADKAGNLHERPAIVVCDNGASVNLQVMIDGSNDVDLIAPHEYGSASQGLVWRTSVRPAADMTSPQVGCWRWPPRV